MADPSRHNALHFVIPASVVSAGLYSFMLSHCWYGSRRARAADAGGGGGDDDAAKGSVDPVAEETNEPAVTAASCLLEAVCLHHLTQATPGCREGRATAWLEVTVLGSLMHISSRLMQYSLKATRPAKGGQVHNVGFDLARVGGCTAVLLGVEHFLTTALADD
eukprot:TRINITY_DN4535_c0_g1_i1.p1 TRINITY_DN4535_c0_g1~~TRINITY_DN4535_c0_g1_i1.p1  ORF type:complete len:163 (+),score=45.67 TRINITY_DN4535_c0_g1_i1:167-655(+)